ncbi:MAG: diguanylate cyclase [bacterium]|nr:diguanylate cyclase [bacterium]
MRSAPRPLSSFYAPALVGCGYFLAASLALLISRFEGGLAFIWGANALLMARLLTSRRRHWPPVIVACALASALSTSLFGMGPAAAIPMAVANVIEALTVAILCRRFAPDRKVAGSIAPLIIFILALCGVANVLAGAVAGLVASLLTPVSFGASWVQWYIGHVLGGLTCTPLLILFLQGELGRWFKDTSLATKLEALVLLLLFSLVTWGVFYHARYPMLFAPMVPLVLIAFRIGHLGSAASIIILATIGGIATLSGHGPINLLPGTAGDHIQFFQVYLALCFLLSLPVAAELNGRRRLFRLLQDSEARYRVIAEHSGDVVLNISVDGTIQYASPSATEQIGCKPELLVGQSAANLIDPLDRAVVIATHRRALSHPGGTHKVEFRPLLSTINAQWCEMVTRAVVDERGVTCGVISTVRDISRHKAQQHALQQVAAVDSLTGADSRRAFLDKLDREVARAGQGTPSCLLLIDIDHFKAVNDRYGHGAGDRVLTTFVERLRPGLRSTDSIGRLGGEEFAILIADSDIARASMVCERLRKMVAAPVEVAGGDAITVTFSAGLAELVRESDSATLLDAADKALYRAKHGGRNCLRLAA